VGCAEKRFVRVLGDYFYGVRGIFRGRDLARRYLR